VTLFSTEPEVLFPEPPKASHRIPYQPSLDGIRGLAVLAVVLYHANVPWATGGYLGVDAFFCLSGYLITSLLLAEWRDTGHIALVQFWARRARRLLPALFVMLTGMALFCVFVAKPDVLDQLRLDGISTLFYFMNWRLIASSQSYFDQFFASPFRHMWSLAIEEQYYLVWPLITAAVLALTRSAKAMLWLCAALAALSAGLMIAMYRPDVDPLRLYYGTDTRAQSLLIGSALAAAVASGLFFRTRGSRTLVVLGAVASCVILGFLWVTLPADHPLLYRGGFVVSGLGVALVITACTQVGSNPLRSALSFEPLRRLGLISYGVYLYHWPIYQWLDGDRLNLSPTSYRLLAVRLAVTLVAAVASFLLIERPIRQGALSNLRLSPTMRTLLAPICATLVLLLLLTTTANARRSTATPADYDPSRRPPPSVGAECAGCSRILLVGDSVAYTMGVGFEATDANTVARSNQIAVWNQGILFCELVKGAHMENNKKVDPSTTCANWEKDWQTDLDWKPDASVLQLGAWEIFDREIDGRWVKFGTPEYDAILMPILQKAVDVLSSKGAPVIVLTTPRFVREDGTGAPEWTKSEVARTDHFNSLLRDLAAKNLTKVALVDLNSYLCPSNECVKDIGGVRMRPDGLHFKPEDAQVAAEWLSPQFRKIAQNGIGPPGPGPAVSSATTPSGAIAGPTTTALDSAGVVAEP
jgi:peptidoglycan/LPS O-acetylase OafA/YrhL